MSSGGSAGDRPHVPVHGGGGLLIPTRRGEKWEGRLKLAGPFPAIDAEDPGPAGFTGSLIVAEFACLVDARAWADADPYLDAGVYATVDVRPFRQALP